MRQERRTTGRARGPLRVHPENPRYFTDGSGRAVYLAGSHTWANWVEHKIWADEPDFDYPGFLSFLVGNNHNFMRLWGWEHVRWATWDGTGRFFAYPSAYARTGPGTALDGLGRFDLTRFAPEYFERLRRRAIAAGERGIYVAVKLFDGFSVGFKDPQRSARWIAERNPYRGHPFHAANNVNGIDGDPDGDGQGKEVQTLRIPAITRLQEGYVREVIDTVHDLDNVLYEVCNESDGTAEAVEWQYYFIDFIKQYEASKGQQHPVGMTVPWPGGRNETLFASGADWVSPNHTEAEPYKTDPPAADGRKVIVNDTDHLWGHGGEAGWVWKSLCRGLNVLLMDPWEPLKGSDLHTNNYRDHPTWEPVRRSMGHARAYAEKMDLAAMRPAGEAASTGYCLGSPGREYLVYQPGSGRFAVDLAGGRGRYGVEWFDPTAGAAADGGAVNGGGRVSFTAPFEGQAVLYLKVEVS